MLVVPYLILIKDNERGEVRRKEREGGEGERGGKVVEGEEGKEGDIEWDTMVPRPSRFPATQFPLYSFLIESKTKLKQNKYP